MKSNKLFGEVSISLKTKEQLKGNIFLIPLIIGLITFFIIPVIKSFLFSIGDVVSGSDGYQVTITGFSAFMEALTVHTSYRQTVVEAIINVVLTTPLIILFSFFMASVLNQDFIGKTFFRVVLFMPLILTVMTSYDNSLEGSMNSSSGFKGSMSGMSADFTGQLSELIVGAGISDEIASNITGLVDSIYGVIGLSAIQILIMLVGMQSISPSLYEAAMVEGATPWERFWKITFPMISPLIFTCIIYTVIDSFTSNNNKVMELMSTTAFSDLKFSLASAMGWIYFGMIAVMLVAIVLLVKRFVFSYND